MNDQYPSSQSVEIMTGVLKGVPDSFMETGVYTVENTPHIHKANLTVLDRDGDPDKAPEAVNVFVAHGYASPEGEWVLADGSKVTDKIEEYNKYYPAEPVEFAAVCNPVEGAVRHMDAVGHASGSEVAVSGFMGDSGLEMTVRLEDPDAGVWFLPHKKGTTQMVVH